MFGHSDYEREKRLMLEEEREEAYKEGYKEAYKEAFEEGFAEGALKTLAGVVKDGILTEDEAAEMANLSVEEFRKKVALI